MQGYNVDMNHTTHWAYSWADWDSDISLNALTHMCMHVAVSRTTHRGHRRVDLGGDSSLGPFSLSPPACVCWLAAPLGTLAVRTLKHRNTQHCKISTYLLHAV